jgi:1-acyl-sn-glycerol-3-phosphate acyltransferase
MDPDAAALSGGERLRLCWRGAWAFSVLATFFAVFLLVRALDWLLERIAGRPVTRLGARVVQGWAAMALPMLGLRSVAHGVPLRGPGALGANHSSWIAIGALQRAAAPFLVSKSEVRGGPAIGTIGRAIGTMFVDRRPAAAKRQEAELLARLGRGDRMAMFPEGTSTDGSRVLPFKSSLFGVFFAPGLEGRVAVQPVSITYHPRPGLPADFYAWWGEMDFAPHLLAVLARSTGGRVELTFHPPLTVSAAGDRKALAGAAERAVRAGVSGANLPGLASQPGMPLTLG